eukprot:1181043-Prorocentrum_minimum.AAC.4
MVAPARKVRNWTRNAIVVPEYTEANLLDTIEDGAPSALRTLWEYLDDTVLAKMQHAEFATRGGVQRIVREFPYPG